MVQGFQTFLGGFNLQKITIPKPRGTLRVEESNSPRKVLVCFFVLLEAAF